MERFGSAPPRKFDSLTRLGKGKKREDALKRSKGSFLEIFGEKREGRFSAFFVFFFFFHLYMTTLFLLGTLLFFAVASAGNLFFFLFFFTRRFRLQLRRFPFRTTTSSPFFCPLAVKNNREEGDIYIYTYIYIFMASSLWTELVMD